MISPTKIQGQRLFKLSEAVCKTFRDLKDRFEKDMEQTAIEKAKNSVNNLKMLQELGVASVFKDINYPTSIADAYHYLQEKDDSLLQILSHPLIVSKSPNKSLGSLLPKDRHSKHKGVAINALTKEREQIKALDTWLDKMLQVREIEFYLWCSQT